MRRRVPCRPFHVALAGILLTATACSSEPAVPQAERSAAAGEAAGCELNAPGFDGDASHLELSGAPPAAELYDRRPALGGPHSPEWLTAGVYDAPVEERSAVHNLEHGAVAVWVAPDAPEEDVASLTEWAQDRNDAGLLDERTGAGLLVAPWDDDLPSPFAFRAWGVAADCGAFDPAFADTFVGDHFGTAGVAPEGSLGSDPGDAIPDPEA